VAPSGSFGIPNPSGALSSSVSSAFCWGSFPISVLGLFSAHFIFVLIFIIFIFITHSCNDIISMSWIVGAIISVIVIVGRFIFWIVAVVVIIIVGFNTDGAITACKCEPSPDVVASG
jgi:hypothetical protein